MKNVFVIILFIISTTAYSTTFYIDPAGQDISSRNGSKSSPWKTLAYACSRVKTTGDIIHVNSGTYRETIQSTLAAGVSIEGEGTASNIISNVSKLNTFTIFLNSSTEAANGNQHISNIKMDGNALTAFGAIKVAYRKNVEIYNCTFTDFNYYGVSFSNGEPPTIYATGNKFHHNTVTNCAGYYYGNRGSLEIRGQDGMLIYNNNMSQNRSNGMNGDIIYAVEGFLKNVKIYNNTFYKKYIPGTTPNDFALELWNCLGGVEIYDNEITGSIDIVRSSYKSGNSYCVWIHNNILGQDALMASEFTRGVILESYTPSFISDIIVEKNYIKNVAQGMFIHGNIGDVCSINNLRISGNIFDNIGSTISLKGWGIYWSSEDNFDKADNINIFNNVFIAQSGSYSTMYGIGLPTIGTATNVRIRNNIIVGFDNSPIYASGSGSTTIRTLSIENNLFYGNGNSNAIRYVDGMVPSSNTTQNNLIGNPLFISSSDFHLRSGSPAIGKGIKITGLTTDYDGNAYNDPPSIGAHEYIVAAVPVYQSSVISNTAPAILEMTFNINLANIIPAASTFTVLVNSVARNINSVAISGTKVRLTLASAVVAGDVITVSYARPSANPIQTPLGGQADNISAKSVTNNVVSAVPVYTGSVIENLTPSLLEITFSLSLVNVIPTPSAFNVLVNSFTRIVNSIAISGNKVRLTLSGSVKYGDIVTVSYTKPATNPLQGSSGSESASFVTKAVTNNVAEPAKPNEPPTVVISNEPEGFSGFVGHIDATGTYDLNNDPLIFTWIVPEDVSVSSTSEAKIRFLFPKVEASRTIQFALTVSDGLSSISKSVPITILPYKPELSAARITDVEASDYEAGNYPENILDGDVKSNWAASGDNHWLLLKLTEAYKISHIENSFLKGQRYSSTFDIYASQDNVLWDPILIQAVSCDFSGDHQIFDFPSALTNKEYSYIKLICHGNSQNNLNIISESKVFGTLTKLNTGQEQVVIYPNPALDYFNIEVNTEMIFPNTVRIYDLTGKIVYENFYGSGLINVKIPSSIKSGIYIVNLTSGSLTLHAQQIIIKR